MICGHCGKTFCRKSGFAKNEEIQKVCSVTQKYKTLLFHAKLCSKNVDNL